MKITKQLGAVLLILVFMTSYVPAYAFCGFYVAKADAGLFNNKSEVIFVRKGNRSVITMNSDFKGDVKDFAMVVPVPVVLQKKDIREVRGDLFSKMDEYSGPRLVEYYDPHPCAVAIEKERLFSAMALAPTMTMDFCVEESMAFNYGVTIEAQYEVGDYDVLILSAKESTGLKDWLLAEDYKIPAKAEDVLEPYIKNQMKFFVVKVNLERNKLSGGNYLKPLQIEFESERFMLPIRLGMANSQGEQDMLIYLLTDNGRVECTNYRTVEMPTDRNIPAFVEDDFGEFYKDLFEKSYNQEGKNAVFLEYAWNVSPTWAVKCDPCNGPPPVNQDLVDAGVHWITNGQGSVFFTRMHVRYSRDKFPQDLQFQLTPNNQQFQCRYVMNHPPVNADFSCDEGQSYLRDLERRRKKEVDELTALTGWSVSSSSSYVYEFSNQIERDQKNESPLLVWWNSGNGKTGLALILLLALSSFAVSVWLGLKLGRQKVNHQ